MNYKGYFLELISGFFEKNYDRKYIAEKISNDIDIDEIKGDRTCLLINCEWALRHINETDFYTTEAELKYLLSCLKGERNFSEQERDRIIKERHKKL